MLPKFFNGMPVLRLKEVELGEPSLCKEGSPKPLPRTSNKKCLPDYSRLNANSYQNHLAITTLVSVKNWKASLPCPFKSPNKDSPAPPNGKKAMGAAMPMLIPIMLGLTRY